MIKRSIFIFACYSIVFTLLGGIGSCKKEVKESGPFAPAIGLLSISPDTVVEFRDSVVIVLQYEDRDGDLGSPDPDEIVLEVLDSRLSTPDGYHVKPLSPPGFDITIQGTLQVTLNTLFILGNADNETTTFRIRMFDQKRNVSNEVVSSPIVIVRE
jgi:hypothetical protein